MAAVKVRYGAPARYVPPVYVCGVPGCTAEAAYGEGAPLTLKGQERQWCSAHVPPSFFACRDKHQVRR